MAVLALYTIIIALKFLSVASNPAIIASAPNLMRIGNEETVLVSLHNRAQPVDVTVRLKLFENGDDGIVSESVVTVGEDPECAYLYVDPEIIPSPETEEELQRYAYVTVTCPELGFEETKPVLLSYDEGFLFIQTDKPIYTPNQSVKIRVISLDQYLTPSSQKIQVDILTPQGVIVRRSTFEEEEIINGILENRFFFDQEPMFGHWKIVVHYGKDLRENQTVQFEVKEYVLPTFSVKVHPPKYILPTADRVTIRVESRYVYGKPVHGRCFVKIGVQEENEEPIIYKAEGTSLNHGEANMDMETNLIGENWFEENVGKSLYVEVTVVEDTTGHIENASDTSAKFVRSPYMFSWKRTIRYFKKGLPYEVKTDLKFMNGIPAPGVRVKVIALATIEGQQNEMPLEGAQRDPQNGDNGLEATEADTNDKGEVNFRLYVPRQCTNIRIVLETDDPELEPRGDSGIGNNARLEFNIPPFESPTGNEYLVLRAPNQNIRPGSDNLEVDVFLNSVTAAPVLHYFMISRGTLMTYGKKNVANVDGLSIPIPYEAVPSARIVAYYIIEGGHVISDSIWVEFERRCENPLRVTPHPMTSEGDVLADSILPGQSINPQAQIALRVRGTPGTSVALLAVDQAVLLLRDYHRLTPDKMYGAMDEHDTGCGPGGGRNPAHVFKNAGLIVLTNLNLDVSRREGPVCATSVEGNRRKRSVSDVVEENARIYACEIGERRLRLDCEARVRIFARRARNQLLAKNPELYEPLSEQNWEELLELLKSEFLECCRNPGQRNIGRSDGVDLTDPRFIVTKASDVLIRNDFRESWAFDIVHIPEDPQELTASVDQIYSVPGSITTWSLQAFGLHNTLAMCVLNPVDILVFTELFIQLHMPYSVVRKEFVDIRVTLFNYHPQALAVHLFLEVPDEICSESLPNELSQTNEITVSGNDAVTITYTLVGLETGEFPIKVAGLSPLSSDVVVKKLRVVPEGVVETIQHSTILNPAGAKLDADSQDQEQDEELECDGILMVNDGTQRNCFEINLPPTAIPDSTSCFVSITGNALGPILTSVISGLGSWIRLPSGCGEQTMIRLAPNVYVLRYLTNTGSGTDAERNTALSNTESGIARELTFRHPDGSYSAWVHRKSSTWLTAFVGKVFCQASEFTFVDTKASCGAIKWLITAQRDDGAIVEGLAVIHKEMSGGVQGDAAMTAFALIAMSECHCVAEVPELAESISKATAFLEGQLSTIQRPYVIAIVTYALALVESGRAFDANNRLKSIAIYDGGTEVRYWGTDDSSLGGNRPYWYRHRPSAISVETTGYALLAQLALSEISYSHPIVKWLSQQQNYGGGFVSTQDTVIALQALSEYATLNTGGNLDMYCNVTAPENFKTVLRLQQGEALVKKTQRIPQRSIKGSLMIKTGGEGVGQLNVEVQYNNLVDNTDADCRFDLNITSERIGGSDDRPFEVDDKVRIRICALYLGEEKTSMAILDVGLYSGFGPVKSSLDDIVNGDGLIERTETSERSVIFYADHIPVEAANPLCFEFEATCENKVGNIQHASVHVYDYYEPAEECTRYYAPEGTNLPGSLCNSDGMCRCVSSKCADCSDSGDQDEEALLDKACATAETYVYKIEVINIETENGFKIISAIIETVIKRGDDQNVFMNVELKFWVSSSCRCPDMRRGKKYMVMGRNYLRYQDAEGEIGYKYIIDQTATVRRWKKGRRFSAYLENVADRILNGDSNCG